MAVPSSGAISLNDFHTEAGGSSGSQCSLNDSDIRGLIGKGSGATMSFNEWYGASGLLWTPTMTVGQQSNKSGTVSGYFNNVGGLTGGSINDTTVDFLSGNGLSGIYHVGSNSSVVFATTYSGSNTGFTSMKVGFSGGSAPLSSFTQFNRASASFSSGNWTWTGASNPFTTGANIIIQFE
tara:strand:- start:6146 stop:6685 length:540 start_codon:yes stop_codon:yes gene_type:complete